MHLLGLHQSFGGFSAWWLFLCPSTWRISHLRFMIYLVTWIFRRWIFTLLDGFYQDIWDRVCNRSQDRPPAFQNYMHQNITKWKFLHMKIILQPSGKDPPEAMGPCCSEC